MSIVTDTTTPTTCDPAEIAHAAGIIIGDGNVCEVRALEALMPGDRFPGTFSGYFDDIGRLVDSVCALRSARGIYVTPSPVAPALLARAHNRLKRAGRGATTADGDVTARRWLLIDVDAVRPSGISATNAERDAAMRRAAAIRDALQVEGWPDPIEADSGNGAHLLYRVDLPADDGQLVRRCLAALADRFDDERVTIDRTVYNPARIVRLYGTPACKGDPTPERPHRVSRLIRVPDELRPVRVELLEALANQAKPPTPSPRATASGAGQAFDVQKFLDEHGIEADGPHPWNGGQRWVLPVCPWNAEHDDRAAHIEQHASGAISAGCHHNGCAGKGWADFRALYDVDYRDRGTTGDAVHGAQVAATLSARADAVQSGDASGSDATPRAVTVRLCDVSPEPVRWLWPERIALGKLTLIAGDPGLGKSFMTLDLAARVSTGSGFPDRPGESYAPGGVVLIGCEDDLADTIRPRLDAAGADVRRIVALEAIERIDRATGAVVQAAFTLANLPQLEQAITTTPDCRLVVIDPISAYMGVADSHKNAEVRAVLAELSSVAAKHGVAVVAVTHLSKGGGDGKAAIYRAMGSLAFTAAARAVFALARDRNDESGRRRLLLPVKNNIGNDQTGLAFGLAPQIGHDAPCVAWEAAPVTVTADEALAPPERRRGPEPERRDEAAEWLRQALAAGARPAKDVAEEAREAAGITKRTLDRAKQELGVIAYRDEVPGPWWWRLPEGESEPCATAPRHDGTLGVLGNLGNLGVLAGVAGGVQ